MTANIPQPSLEPVALSLFAHRVTAVCEEMGAVLRRAAFSPNIRDRLDYSCALFDATGQLCAQAAHIPVHLGSMAWAMQSLVDAADWQPGDCLMLNDPFLGGTHLPDVTLIAPLFLHGELAGFVANRAHHARIGSDTPGSMPLARTLAEEGLVIPPMLLARDGALTGPARALLSPLCELAGEVLPGDFSAQLAANRVGLQRLVALAAGLPEGSWRAALQQLNEHGARLADSVLAGLPEGDFAFVDYMEDDGLGGTDIPLAVRISIRAGRVVVDFDGTGPQVAGNINCPMPVTAAAVFYVFRCLMPADTPACSGVCRNIGIRAPLGTLVNAQRPAAVAAGNVETSMRIVDVLLGALAQAIPEQIPAASQGTMNNLAMGVRAGAGARGWDYYETMAGGAGASAGCAGRSAVQTHMTNTLNTPIEVLESSYPLRVHRYAVRTGSGGRGRQRGGDGVEREIEFLAPAALTLLTERRRLQPWGLQGGQSALPGRNLLNGRELPGKFSGQVASGDCLLVQTPGGGGYGSE